MDVRQLRSFDAIARVGSYRKAADRLGVSQPALTRQILELEQELGAAVFVRRRDGIGLTRAGELLLGHAELILSHMSAAKSEISSHNSAQNSELGIGAPPGMGVALFCALADRISASHPNLSLRFYEAPSERLLELMSDGSVDIAIVNFVDESEFIAEHIIDEPMFLVSCTDDDLPSSIEELRQLADLPLILSPAGSTEKGWFEQLIQSHSIKLNVPYRASSVHVVKELVMRGHAYALLAKSAVSADIAAGRLRGSKVDGILMPRFLARRRSRYHTPLVGAVGQHMREAVAALAD